MNMKQDIKCLSHLTHAHAHTKPSDISKMGPMGNEIVSDNQVSGTRRLLPVVNQEARHKEKREGEEGEREKGSKRNRERKKCLLCLCKTAEEGGLFCSFAHFLNRGTTPTDLILICVRADRTDYQLYKNKTKVV